MALDFDRDTRSSAASKGNFKKAGGFINFYFPTVNEDGTEGKFKIDALTIKAEGPEHIQLLEWLKKDPANLAKFMAKVQVTFHTTRPEDAKGRLALD